MVSKENRHGFGFYGSEHFMQAYQFYGCTASELTAKELAAFKSPKEPVIRRITNPVAATVVRELTLIDKEDLMKHILR